MFVISGRDVNENYHQAGILLRGIGQREETRNGPALVAPRPVTTHYHNPCERVLFDERRDANPFFHLMESLWILAGWQEVAWLAQFNKRIADYSDDGETFHAAYGHRLRHWPWGQGNALTTLDQLDQAVKMLQTNPGNRRVVLSIWDPALDLNADSKDIPCNDMIKLEVREGALNMVVFNRSNDIIWGCYGANVVQFSMLLEYLAGRIGVAVGWMEQVSTNWHAYVDIWEAKRPYDAPWDSPYAREEVAPYPLMSEPRRFDRDLERFMEWTCRPDLDKFIPAYSNPFFDDVAEPLFLAWRAYKAKDFRLAQQLVSDVRAGDWQLAAHQWLLRRELSR